MSPVENNRLKWKCRRGLLELDIVLARYLARHPGDRQLGELLELADPELWDVVARRSEAFPPHLKELVARLRAA